LIEAVQVDPARFAELYDLHFHRVYAYVSTRVAGRAEVEDVVSEAFHRAFSSIKQYEDRGAPFSAWLFRIAANVISSHGRSAKVQVSQGDHSIDEAGIGEIEELAVIAQMVSGLPEDQRRVVVARFVNRMSVKDIASELGRTEGAIKQLQYRALEALRTKLEAPNG